MTDVILRIEAQEFDKARKGWHVNGTLDDQRVDGDGNVGVTVSGRHFIPVNDPKATYEDLLAAIREQYGVA